MLVRICEEANNNNCVRGSDTGKGDGRGNGLGMGTVSPSVVDGDGRGKGKSNGGGVGNGNGHSVLARVYTGPRLVEWWAWLEA